jgi:hypothetical protein
MSSLKENKKQNKEKKMKKLNIETIKTIIITILITGIIAFIGGQKSKPYPLIKFANSSLCSELTP